MGILEKLRARMNRAGIRPSVRRGQNFLLDMNILRFIVETARLGSGDVILEVGPGSGFLTRRLALSGGLVLAVELDRGLLPLAEEETRGLPNVFYLQGDILEGKNSINPEALAKVEDLLRVKAGMLAAEAAKTGSAGAAPRPALKCVSNLPYSAGTPFVMNLLSSPLPWRTGVFLLQKEVAERIVAPPGGRNFGSLSIGAALAAETVIERDVPPYCFWPRPAVDSAIVRMEFLPPGERSAIPWKGVRRVAAAVFGSRRKTLRNALKGVFPDRDAGDVLAEFGIDPGCRGETLPPRDFARLGGLLA